MSKLLLCSGAMDYGSEWMRLDANPLYTPDIVATIPPLPYQVKSYQWEAIELIHGIEHFFLWEAEQLLRECYEVLETGGVLALEQPNIEFAARVMCGLESPLTTTPDQSTMWPLYGDPTHRNPLYGHRWGWTPETLINALVVAGFTHMRGAPVKHHLAKRDFRLEAVK